MIGYTCIHGGKTIKGGWVMKQTIPKWIRANGLTGNPFTGKKKYRITCGECEHTYSDKVYFSYEINASSVCPCCGTQNKWSQFEFAKKYTKKFGID